MFIGVLILVKGGLVSFFVGLYTTVVGAIIYFNSVKAYSALNDLKRKDPNSPYYNLSDAQVIQKFYAYDKNADGFIDASEFEVLCKDLGCNLSSSEVTSALLILDTNDDGKICMEEFKSWWSAIE